MPSPKKELQRFSGVAHHCDSCPRLYIPLTEEGIEIHKLAFAAYKDRKFDEFERISAVFDILGMDDDYFTFIP